jgi:XTP/dITP diphosphohydrolase
MRHARPSPVASVVLASRNPGKLTEFRRLLGGTGWELVPLPEDLPPAPEDGATYADNAAAKARAAAQATGLPALGDDSGIEVDALGGFPGIRSARWTKGDGPAELLRKAAGLPSERRSARMRAAIALAWPDGRLVLGEGSVEGRLAPAPRGHGGFGYDVIFELPDGRTLAEVSDEEKDRIAHRGRAVRALLARLRWPGSPRSGASARAGVPPSSSRTGS